jgi:hypothetical protein
MCVEIEKNSLKLLKISKSTIKGFEEDKQIFQQNKQ